MDNDDSKHLIDLAEENIKIAKEYYKARKEYAEAKLYLDLQIALEMPLLQAKRKNIGYDMAILSIVEIKGNSDECRGYYETLIKQKSKYKGLEKVMNAISNRISLGQSLIKNKIQEGG